MTAIKPLRRIDSARDGRFYETPDGQRYPSVTHILSSISKPALLNWYASVERAMVIEAAADLYHDAPATKMNRLAFVTSLQQRLGKTRAAQKALSEASDIGSQCHALIEWNLRRELGQEAGEEPRISDKALWAFMCWEEWRKTVELEPLWIEQMVYSKEYGYAGTLDLVATLHVKDEYHDYGRTLAVIDWKTGKAVYPEARLQNVAYAFAYREMGHTDKPIPGLIVRLPKTESDPAPEAVVVHIDEQQELFDAFLNARGLWVWQQKNEVKRKEKRGPDGIHG